MERVDPAIAGDGIQSEAVSVALRSICASVSEREFVAKLADPSQCEQMFIACRWGDGFLCQSCGSAKAWSFRRNDRDHTYMQCAGCDKQWSLVCGTEFEGTRLPLASCLLASYLLGASNTRAPASLLMRRLGVSFKTASLLKRRIVKALKQSDSPRPIAAGTAGTAIATTAAAPAGLGACYARTLALGPESVLRSGYQATGLAG